MNNTSPKPASRVKPLLERIVGVGLLVVGGRVLWTGEFKYHRVLHHGAFAYVADGTLVALAVLMWRGRIFSANSPDNWTWPDKVAGLSDGRVASVPIPPRGSERQNEGAGK